MNMSFNVNLQYILRPYTQQTQHNYPIKYDFLYMAKCSGLVLEYVSKCPVKTTYITNRFNILFQVLYLNLVSINVYCRFEPIFSVES